MGQIERRFSESRRGWLAQARQACSGARTRAAQLRQEADALAQQANDHEAAVLDRVIALVVKGSPELAALKILSLVRNKDGSITGAVFALPESPSGVKT